MKPLDYYNLLINSIDYHCVAYRKNKVMGNTTVDWGNNIIVKGYFWICDLVYDKSGGLERDNKTLKKITNKKALELLQDINNNN